MSKARIVAIALVAVVAIAAIAGGGAYLFRGERYRLYTDARAGHCWDALRRLAPPSSSLRPVRVAHGGGGPAPHEITIGYRLDRVLAGFVLEVRCVYGEGDDGASSIELNGSPIDAALLAEINEAAAR